MLDELKDLSALMPAVQYLALNLGITLVLLIAGWSVSSLAGRSVRKLAARSSRVDPTIVPMVYTLTVWAIRLFVLIAVLARFGVQPASIVVVVGSGRFAIFLALQGK